jgi:hypothetical protein
LTRAEYFDITKHNEEKVMSQGVLPNFDQTDESGRKYRQISLPGGTFRMYEDTPFVWNQIFTYEGEKSILQRIDEAFANNSTKK